MADQETERPSVKPTADTAADGERKKHRPTRRGGKGRKRNKARGEEGAEAAADDGAAAASGSADAKPEAAATPAKQPETRKPSKADGADGRRDKEKVKDKGSPKPSKKKGGAASPSGRSADRPARKEPEEIGEPIAREAAEVDQFYEAGIREGGAQVFVDKHKVAWSVMLKGASDRMMYAVMQLVTHDDCCVVYTRRGRINEGGEAAKESYAEFPNLPEAKEGFEAAFLDITGNEFAAVKRCVTKFVNRKEYTLLADVKAARRSENETNRVQREDREKQVIAERNKHIVEQVKASVGADDVKKDDAKKPAAAGSGKGKKGAAQDAGSAMGLATAPAIRTEDRRVSPKPPGLDQPTAERADSGELSPAEPPATPATKPNAAPSKPSPKVMAQPPPAPRQGPARPPSTSSSAKPAAAVETPTKAPATKKVMVHDGEDETESKGGIPLAVIAGGVAALAIAGYVFLGRKRN